jgi:hypothetical protein
MIWGVKEMVEGMPLLDRVEEFCDGCALGKQRRYSFPQVAGCSSSHNLDLVHAYLWTDQAKDSRGKNYFLLIVDDHSCYMWVEFLATKDEAFKCFKRVKALVESKSSSRLKAFCSDYGGSSTPLSFKNFIMSMS